MSSAPNRRNLLKAGALGGTFGVLAGAGAAPALGQPSTGGLGAREEKGAAIAPASVQVLFIDLQTSLVAQSRTSAPAAIETASGVLAKVAQILRLPTLFSVVPEQGRAQPQLIGSLTPFSTAENTLLRKPAGALMDPATVQAITRSGRRTIVMAGYAAEVAVLHAALDAIAAGYMVYYVVDCIGSPSPRTEAAAFRELDLAGAIPTSVLSLTTRLAPDFFHPPGSETFAALAPILKP